MVFCSAVSIFYTLREEMPVNIYIGNVQTDANLLTAEYENITWTFSLVTTDNRYKDLFIIDSTRGSLYTSTVVDREALCLHRAYCILPFEVNVTSDDINNFTFLIINVSINIHDINDNAPIFPAPPLCLRSISENAKIGTTLNITDKRADDLDYGINGIQIYRIVSLDGNNVPFSINPDWSSSLELSLDRPLDREIQETYVFTILAVDGGTPPRSAALNVVITVNDDNDNIPYFSQQNYKTNISRDYPLNCTILRVSATDIDAGVNGLVSYRLSAVQEARNLEVFDVDHKTGDIKLIASLRNVSQTQYSLRVEAYDAGIPSTYNEVIVTVIVQLASSTTSEGISQSGQGNSSNVIVTHHGINETSTVIIQTEDHKTDRSYGWYIASGIAVFVLIVVVLVVYLCYCRTRHSTLVKFKSNKSDNNVSDNYGKNTKKYNDTYKYDEIECNVRLSRVQLKDQAGNLIPIDETIQTRTETSDNLTYHVLKENRKSSPHTYDVTSGNTYQSLTEKRQSHSYESMEHGSTEHTRQIKMETVSKLTDEDKHIYEPLTADQESDSHFYDYTTRASYCNNIEQLPQSDTNQKYNRDSEAYTIITIWRKLYAEIPKAKEEQCEKKSRLKKLKIKR